MGGANVRRALVDSFGERSFGLCQSVAWKPDFYRERRVAIQPAEAWRAILAVVNCRFIAFVPGRRPTDEDVRRGLGSSDCVALVTGEDRDNRTVVLFEVSELPRDAAVEVTVDHRRPAGAGLGSSPGRAHRARLPASGAFGLSAIWQRLSSVSPSGS